MWRDALSQWEKGFNEFAGKTTQSEQFSEGMNRAMGASLQAKKVSSELSNRYLAAFNIPNRDDVTAIADQLQSIEDRLIELTSMVERLSGASGAAAPAPAGPRRTRKPPPAEDAPAATPAPAPTAAKRKARK